MLGGYQILDLRKIALSYGGSAVNITDAVILNQLRNIREYIEKGHNYKKALNNALKPYLIRYRDQKVGETKEVSEYAAIESTGSALTYKIKAKHIEIEVVFEEKTDEDDNKYYDIKTAKYVYNLNEAIFENIVDSEGHKRFIEGDITFDEITGLTQKYGKWSLSGTHLLIVVAGSIANATALNGKIATVELPEWIIDKLQVVYGNAVLRQTDNVWASDGSTNQSAISVLGKSSNVISINEYITANADREFRIQFDLLIDTESQE